MRTLNKKINGLNSNQSRRDELVGVTKNEKYLGGIARFENLSIDNLQTLLDEEFANRDDCQNDSPTISEFRQFMVDHPEVTAHGYVVDKSRDDYRISIEGLFCERRITMSTMEDFVRLCRYADEFVCTKNMLYSWWD